MGVYKLAVELEALMQSEDVTDDALQAAFGNLADTAESVCQYLTTLTGEIDLYKAEEQRLQTRRKSLERLQERSKDQIKDAMFLLDTTKLVAGSFSLSVQKTAGKIVIDEDAVLDSEYLVLIPESYTIDRAKVKDALNAGVVIEGAHIQPGTSLGIR